MPVPNGHEFELKLELDPRDAGDLRRHPLLAGAEASTRAQCSTYFDTRKNALRKAGYSLRVRSSGGKYVQTVKRTSAGAGLFNRPEWEVPVEHDRPDAAAIAETPVGEIIGADRVGKLVPVVESASNARSGASTMRKARSSSSSTRARFTPAGRNGRCTRSRSS
ncbi:MAG TPA: CYTH domain-containing protein [Allosphingosinicella sp.]|jgi:inorganic triphosphatase YgiF|nr:CYTH domain-containing protein [Allosphingosinicella sp.]